MSDYKDAKPENYVRGLLVPRVQDCETFDKVRLYEYVEIGSVFRNHLEEKPDFLYAVNKNVIVSTIGSQRVIVTENGRLGIGEQEPKSALHFGKRQYFFEESEEPDGYDGYEGDGYSSDDESDDEEQVTTVYHAELDDNYITFQDVGKIGVKNDYDTIFLKSIGNSGIEIAGQDIKILGGAVKISGDSVEIDGLTAPSQQGPYRESVKTIDVDYQIQDEDHVIIVNGLPQNILGNQITITLPDAPEEGRAVVIKDAAFSSNSPITINSSLSIEGQQGPILIDVDKQSLKLIWDGSSSWWVI